MSLDCLICHKTMWPFIDQIDDYEYGVAFKSKLVKCGNCGLVSHDPPVQADQIPGLYPDNYLAHSATRTKKGLYGRLKAELEHRAVRKIAGRIPRTGTFLEIGCGGCGLIRNLSRTLPHARFIGVDIKQVDIPPIDRFTFVLGQFESADIVPKSIDVLYCSNLIEHVADPREFVRKCFRVLKPGGLLIGVTPDHLSIDRRIFGRYWAGYHYPRHTYVFDHLNLPLLLRQEGFAEVGVTGSYAFWYLSFANRFLKLHGGRPRGLAFFLGTLVMYPFDRLVNFFRCHGSMDFQAIRPQSRQ